MLGSLVITGAGPDVGSGARGKAFPEGSPEAVMAALAALVAETNEVEFLCCGFRLAAGFLRPAAGPNTSMLLRQKFR